MSEIKQTIHSGLGLDFISDAWFKTASCDSIMYYYKVVIGLPTSVEEPDQKKVELVIQMWF